MRREEAGNIVVKLWTKQALVHCHCSSHKRVVKEVQDRMVADHLATVHAETGTMVCSERTRDLSNMYTLLRPVPNGLSQLVHHLKEHIKQQGLQAITSLKGDNVSACGHSKPCTYEGFKEDVMLGPPSL